MAKSGLFAFCQFLLLCGTSKCRVNGSQQYFVLSVAYDKHEKRKGKKKTSKNKDAHNFNV